MIFPEATAWFRKNAELVDEFLGIVFHVGKHVRHRISLHLMRVHGAAAFQVHADDVRVPQQVVQVPQGLLIGSHQEHADVVVFLAGLDGVQGKGRGHVFAVNEMVDLPVAVARDGPPARPCSWAARSGGEEA